MLIWIFAIFVNTITVVVSVCDVESYPQSPYMHSPETQISDFVTRNVMFYTAPTPIIGSVENDASSNVGVVDCILYPS